MDRHVASLLAMTNLNCCRAEAGRKNSSLRGGRKPDAAIHLFNGDKGTSPHAEEARNAPSRGTRALNGDRITPRPSRRDAFASLLRMRVPERVSDMDRHVASLLAMTNLNCCRAEAERKNSSLRGGRQADAAIHASARAIPLILRSIAKQCISKDEGFQFALKPPPRP